MRITDQHDACHLSRVASRSLRARRGRPNLPDEEEGEVRFLPSSLDCMPRYAELVQNAVDVYSAR